MNKYSPEVREHAVQVGRTAAGQHEARYAAIPSISSIVGCAAQKLNEWVKRGEVGRGSRVSVPTEIAHKLKARPGQSGSCARGSREELSETKPSCRLPTLGVRNSGTRSMIPLR